MSQVKKSSKGTPSRAAKSRRPPSSRPRRRRRRPRASAGGVLRSIGETVVEGAEAVVKAGAKAVEGVKATITAEARQVVSAQGQGQVLGREDEAGRIGQDEGRIARQGQGHDGQGGLGEIFGEVIGRQKSR